MSTEAKQQDATDAMWQIPWECGKCKGTFPLTQATRKCHKCGVPIDGRDAMERFWAVLHDEKAWKEWNAKNHKLYAADVVPPHVRAALDTKPDTIEDVAKGFTGQAAKDLLEDIGVQGIEADVFIEEHIEESD